MSAAMGTGAAIGGLLLGLGGFPTLALSLPLFSLAAALLVWLSRPVTLPAATAAGVAEPSATAR